MRVIAGKWRGRRLKGPKDKVIRPTPDRVREALFSIVGDWQGCRVLELFAGTGAFCFEALSRGAASAIAVDQSRAAQAIIKSNAKSLDVGDELTIVRGTLPRALERITGHFEVIYIDPPYDTELASTALAKLVELPSITWEQVIIEHRTNRPPRPIPAELEPLDARRYGDTSVLLLRSSS